MRKRISLTHVMPAWARLELQRVKRWHYYSPMFRRWIPIEPRGAWGICKWKKLLRKYFFVAMRESK